MSRFDEKHNVEVFTLEEWCEFDGEDMTEAYRSAKGVQAVEIFANVDSAICGVKYEDGTFGVFGAGSDMDGVTEEEMYGAIRAGF